MKVIKFIKIGFLSILLIALSGCGGSDTLSKKDIALQALEAYNAHKAGAPTVQTYIDAGIMGVNINNLAEVNQLVLEINAEAVNGTLLDSGVKDKIRTDVLAYLAETTTDTPTDSNTSTDTNTTTSTDSNTSTDTNTTTSTDSNTSTDTNTTTSTDSNTSTDTNTTTSTDSIKPVITLIGADVNLNVGDTYTDAGATATDDVDGDISANIVTQNPVDTSKAGTYTVTYTVSDAAGNAADPVTRTVRVIDPNAPAKKEIWFAFKKTTEEKNLNGTHVNFLADRNGPQNFSSLVYTDGTTADGIVLDETVDFSGLNGNEYTGTASDIVPLEMLSGSSWFVGNAERKSTKGTVVLKGLFPGKMYNLSLGAIRVLDGDSATQQADRAGIYKIQGTDYEFNADDANDRQLTVNSIVVDDNGKITIEVTAKTRFGYLGWLKLIEQ